VTRIRPDVVSSQRPVHGGQVSPLVPLAAQMDEVLAGDQRQHGRQAAGLGQGRDGDAALV
jgi:hypothetical protein